MTLEELKWRCELPGSTYYDNRLVLKLLEMIRLAKEGLQIGAQAFSFGHDAEKVLETYARYIAELERSL